MIDLNTQRLDPTVFAMPFERSAGSFVSNSTYHDFCEFLTDAAGQETFTPVTTSDSLEVVSSSVNDTALGTGIRTVGIVYLDASGNWSEFTTALDGTTPVSLSGISASAIIAMYGKTGGSASFSTGTVNLRNVASPAIIYEQITPNSNRSQSGRFTCPRGYYVLLDDLHISVQGHPVEIKLRMTRSPFNGSNIDRYVIRTGMKLASGATASFPLTGMRLDAGQSLKISGIPDAVSGTPRVHGSLDMEMIKI